MNDTTALGRTDTRDMVVVHTALLREIRLAPAAVVRASTGRARHRTRTAGHLRLLMDLLEYHHHAEDELMLPLLRARVPHAAAHALDTGEEQHARIERLIAEVRVGLERWLAPGRDASGPDAAHRLAGALTALHTELEPHLRAEERDVLPLAAAHLGTAEWAAIGEAGAKAVPTSKLVLLFGMFAHEGDPAVVRAMLAHAPAVARVLLPRIAPAVYARCCRRVHGSSLTRR